METPRCWDRRGPRGQAKQRRRNNNSLALLSPGGFLGAPRETDVKQGEQSGEADERARNPR